MRRVLFVDDEPNVLDALQNLMRRHRAEWEMVFVDGAPSAMRAMRENPFDVVISDMRMPGTDGAELLGAIKEEFPQAVRIILSGYAEQRAAMRAVGVAHRFLSKPCDAETIETTINRACNLRALIEDERVRTLMGRIDSLPSQARTYQALVDKLNDPNAAIFEIAAVIESDVAMSAKLLQLVNSAFFGLPHRVTRVGDAVNYIGLGMIRSLALMASIFDGHVVPARCSIESIQRHALLTGRIARALAADPRMADDAFTAGLLHEIGVLVLGSRFPERFERTMESLVENPRPFHEAEQELWNVTHAELGAYLLDLWGLPSAIVEAVGFHHTPAKVAQKGLDLPALVYVADHLAEEITGPAPHMMGVAHAAIDLDYLASLGVADCLAEWREIAREFADAQEAA